MNTTDRDPFAIGGADPLIALGEEWLRIDALIGEIIDRPGALDQPGDLAPAELEMQTATEARIAALTPRSVAGAIVQLRFLRERMLPAEEWGDRDERMVDAMIAGLEQLGG